MAFAPQNQMPERKTSPGMMNLASNNPFRSAVSPPGALTQNIPSIESRSRPVNTNPFLDDYKPENVVVARQRTRSPQKQYTAASLERPSRQGGPYGDPTGLMNGLSLADKPMPERIPMTRAYTSSRIDPYGISGPRRPSQDVQRRPVKESQAPSAYKELDIFASAEKRERRARRNSESSIMSTEDRKRRERKQKEREARGKDGRPSNPRHGKSEKKIVRGLDIIDKLDVTGIYGPNLFHHDGPFDACNPHRNKRGGAQAPMQAFPEGSANNSMGGSGPVNKTLDLDKFHGRGAEGFSDFNGKVATSIDLYSVPYKRPQVAVNPANAVDVVHGTESTGLGTTTFLEGAPAPRKEPPRRDSEADAPVTAAGPSALQRKKSLAQRIRGMSKSRPVGFGDAGRVLSPEARYEYIAGAGAGQAGSPASPGYLSRMVAQSAGGPARMQMAEVNPFFEDVAGGTGGGVERTQTQTRIRIAEEDYPPRSNGLGRSRTASSPSGRGLGLARRMTNDSGLEGEGAARSGGGGFLSRVKSIRKPKGEKRSP